MDHVLTRSPNIVLSAGSVKFLLDDDKPADSNTNGDGLTGNGHDSSSASESTPTPPTDITIAGFKLDPNAGSAPKGFKLGSAVTRGAILTLDTIPEAAMQPFSVDRTKNRGTKQFFFRPGSRFRVRIFADPRNAGESGRGLMDEVVGGKSGKGKGEVLATGEVVLGEELVVDVDKVNRDPFAVGEDERVGRWREKFGEIGKGLGE